MRRGARQVLSIVAFVCLLAGVSYAGQVTSSISGVVQDSAGGFIPGASIIVTSVATGTKYNAITNSSGEFTVPALPPGTYTVSVSLQGFKTAVITDVRVQPGVPAAVKATLEVGVIAETVQVTGASSELVNTRTATVSSTLNVDQIAQLP